MTEILAEELGRDWLAAHPLPTLAAGTDKNSRGRVLVAGGGRFVPGALRLTGEAALRAGAGKLQLATVADVAMHLGVLVPEAAMIALPADDDGEIGVEAVAVIADALAGADVLVLGPGMSSNDAAAALVATLLAVPRDGLSIVLDAAAIGACSDLTALLQRHDGRVVMTPHHGEMASLTSRDVDAIAADDVGVARDAAARYGAVIALKADTTVIAAPDGRTLRYAGGGVGLATGGSGDVLAGVAGGLIARGADPLTAAAWAVWLHGEAGRWMADTIGPLGFLARELLLPIPRLMAGIREETPIGFG